MKKYGGNSTKYEGKMKKYEGKMYASPLQRGETRNYSKSQSLFREGKVGIF